MERTTDGFIVRSKSRERAAELRDICSPLAKIIWSERMRNGERDRARFGGGAKLPQLFIVPRARVFLRALSVFALWQTAHAEGYATLREADAPGSGQVSRHWRRLALMAKCACTGARLDSARRRSSDIRLMFMNLV